MAQYCTKCGAEKEDNGQSLCQECLSNAEQAADAAAEPAAGAAITVSATPQGQDRQAADKIMPYIELIRKLILSPLDTLRASLGYGNALHGSVIAVSSAIVMSLIGLLFIRGILSLVYGLIGGFSAAMLLSGFGSIPYGEIFIRMLILFVLQWVLLSLIVSGIGRLFGIQVSIVQSLNLIGLTKVYVAIAWIAACILFYLYKPLAIAVLLGGALIGYLAIDRTLNASGDSGSKPHQFYFVPAVLAVYMVAIAIVWSIMS